MALTLDPTLLAAQDSLNRRPICELTVGKGVADFPFVGHDLANPGPQHQSYSLPLFLSDGRLAVFYAGWNGSADYRALRLVLSDAAVSEFGDYLTVDSDANQAIKYLDGLVMPNDVMGLAAYTDRGSSYYIIKAYRVSATGAKLSETDIKLGFPCTGVAVCATPTGYAMVYVLNASGTHTAYLRTSSDFVNWSSATALTLPGLTAGRAVREPRLRRLDDGSYFFLFSYENTVLDTGSIFNLWHSTSTDLITWTTCAAVTGTTSPAQDYVRPFFVQQESGKLFLAVQEANTYLQMTASTPGWNTSDTLTPVDMHVDGDYLYIVSQNIGVGTKSNKATAKINLDTWEIEQFYNGSTTPAINGYFLARNVPFGRRYGAGGYTVMFGADGVCLIDFANNTIKNFMFYDRSGTYGPDVAKNVEWDPMVPSGAGTDQVVGAWVDVANNRLWVFLPNSYYSNNEIHVGYIDLNQSGPIYTFTSVIRNYLVGGNSVWGHHYHVYPDDDMMINCGAEPDYGGHLVVWKLSENARYKWYRFSTHPEFPKAGVTDAVLIGDKIFALPYYDSGTTSELYKHGVLEIDLLTDQMTYHTPSWSNLKISTSSNLPLFGRIQYVPGTDELVINATFRYPVVFNVVTHQWDYKNYGALNAWPSTTNVPHSLLYDVQRDVWLAGIGHNVLYLIPRDGLATVLRYLEAENNAGWTFGEPQRMAFGYNNLRPALALDNTAAIWSTWTYSGGSKNNIRWDKAQAQREMSDYLVGEVSTEWAIDAPGRLTFTLSHGHLFDPSNVNSILNFYLDKGNKAVLRFGERSAGVNYWADQGTYVVREVRLNYARGTYPLAEVVCEDVRCLWAMHQIGVAQALTQYPEEALAAIIKAETPATDDDLSFPNFAGRFVFDAQWLDAYLTDIVDDVCHRFGYFPTVGMDGKITARPISETAAVAHTYATTAELVNFTPDDSYSDLTNRITVTGQSLDDIEVLFAEERLDAFAGTVGWWGFRKDFERWYSTDKSRRARYPRLKVVETSTSILFHLAGKIREGITEIDPDDQYCVVEVTAPNLIPVLIGAIGLYFSAGKIGDAVAAFGAGYTQPVGRAIENVAVCLALMVLGSTGNFQYEIWGQPLGYVKRNYSASANDLDLQNRIGMVVEQKIEGFLCHSPAHCQTVAEFELMLIRLQRSRVNFSKIAHLQDEIGDTLSVPHPITNQAMRIYATHLRRRYKPAVDGDGYFLDEIEGWKC